MSQDRIIPGRQGTYHHLPAEITPLLADSGSDEDFVFYNAPTTPDGAVALSVDGDSEQSIRIDLNLVTDHQTKIVIAAALSARTTFGDLGAVALSIDSASIAATATLDAATTERTLLLAEVYRRRDYWRIRAIGQGYDDGPAELAARYGVSEK